DSPKQKQEKQYMNIRLQWEFSISSVD
ncbi:MAG: hypothetical protein JWN14_4887, partial [Chthonomonadales bacterium]|nr:hypothetical protein [Chthonomonadales bacterium]